MSHAVSPLAPKTVPEMPPIAGVRFATAEAGIKYKNRTDVLLMVFDAGTTVAGVLTRSKCPSAAVDWCRHNLAGGTARALVVNSGNANAFTGQKGKDTVKATADMAAKAAGCRPQDVFLSSTGVIGEPLPAAKFEGVLDGAAKRVAPGPWIEAAKAIMTTDTFPKVATRTATIEGVTVTINGIAKGAGMIAPDMATLLSYVATDAAISAKALQALVSAGVADTFNAITVDSDTSTSDTLLAFATAKAKHAPIDDPRDLRLTGFKKAFKDLLRDLAHQVVKDGEGARKFVEVAVSGATSKGAARTIALSIANSPLVKTAIAGEDANWGRVVMAVGKSGERAERDRLAISFGAVRVAVDGARDPAYSEAAASAEMKKEHVRIGVDLGLGTGRATIWTCDLTKAYVEINGDYRS